jgi:mannitol/fructose-specific phosphotransferase system IIA component (Ntr-type)
MLLVRNRQGIHFSANAPNVEAVFFLFGSKDERNFHLKALSSIAQIVQEPGFIERWRKAKNSQALRDAILLASACGTNL